MRPQVFPANRLMALAYFKDLTTGVKWHFDYGPNYARCADALADCRKVWMATRLNGKGRFLIPGLWDMHSHHQWSGADAVGLFVAKGVVGTPDMGADAHVIFPLRDRIRSGALLGPEIVLSGPMLDDAPAGFPYRRPTKTQSEARIAVCDLKHLGL